MGGGQLGQMLIQSGISYHISFHILDPSATAPCRHLCTDFVQGDFNDYDTVYRFGQNLDLVTIEIEHVNVDALEQLEKEGVAVYPSPKLIRTVQDKGLQKQFFKEHNLPSSDFYLLENRNDIHEFLDFLPAAQKLRTGGYDGKGVSIIDRGNYIDKSFDAPSVLEKKVEINKELSFIVARNVSGEIKIYPPVELLFHPTYNLVEYLSSPASLAQDLCAQGEKIATQLAEDLALVGILAIEMFLDTEGNLLINEIAPRPHNSGHQTIEGNVTSQFEQHLRAILDLPLGDTDAIGHSVMINVLGEEGYSGEVQYEGMEELLKSPRTYVHLYGKSETRPGRKMGHVTIVDDQPSQAKAKAEAIKKQLKVIA